MIVQTFVRSCDCFVVMNRRTRSYYRLKAQVWHSVWGLMTYNSKPDDPTEIVLCYSICCNARFIVLCAARGVGLLSPCMRSLVIGSASEIYEEWPEYSVANFQDCGAYAYVLLPYEPLIQRSQENCRPVFMSYCHSPFNVVEIAINSSYCDYILQEVNRSQPTSKHIRCHFITGR